jgi:hypothetical protein
MEFDFTFNQPFKTKCNWPARLVGVLQRTAFPYVVAVFNPAFNAEELHCYASDGKSITYNAVNYDEVTDIRGGPLSLVNLSDAAYYAVTQETQVHAHVTKLPNWPANCNSMQHDAGSMGTPLPRGWIALHDGYGRPAPNADPLRHVQLVNEVSGERFMVRFAPMDVIEIKAKEVTA